MKRAIGTFFRALQIALRGESLVPAPYRPLAAWMDAVESHLSLVLDTAEAHGFDHCQRQDLQLKLDGRLTSLEQSLQMLRHNLKNEYPRLMRLNDPYSMMVVQSINMNDQYRVSRFLEDGMIESNALRHALEDLNQRLLNLPQIEFPESGNKP
ncbi:MAG: hypothetical protein OXG39_20045 [Chloroflexi bacterium]|nr:hypothetical protein [Chloroflexota bacterium]